MISEIMMTIGTLLREWRETRRLSQLALALDAGISARHVSQVETGKAQPSREMVVRLADALGLPLRERNALLLAAGYAPEYPETPLATPALAQVRHAIALMLEHQEPYPAFVLNRRWDILEANLGAARVARFLIGGSQHANMVHQFFDPADLRAVVVNWEEVAGDIVRHLHGEPAARLVLEEALRYPGVPAHWRNRTADIAPSPLLTVEFRKGDQSLRFFSTITTFGTPRDVTLDELRVECTFPADVATAAFCQHLIG
jgi:transcriptional regulator with XRE-family HTH domain